MLGSKTPRRVVELSKRVGVALAVVALVLVVLALVLLPEVGEPPEALAKPGGGFLELDGFRVYYVDRGSGATTYVLLHGFGASTFSWRYFLEELPSYGRVVAYDRPGFGLTERVDPRRLPYNPYTSDGAVEMLRRLMEALGIRRAVLVGHSAGGGLALLFVLRYPELVECLVLIAPAWRSWSRPWYWDLLLNLPLSERFGPLLVRQYVGTLEQALYRAWYNKTLLTEEVIEGYKYPLKARNWDRGLFWVMKYGGFPDISGELRRVRVPVLVVHGEYDELVPLQSSQELYRALANYTKVSLRVVPGVGHLPHEEAPAETLREVLSFLEELGLLRR